ncbi:MAG: exo-beta-1,3-glucanase [Methylococcales bacterium]|nr:exo-beta-1,3-glucanase [Methylococcales bacterium]
MKLFSWLTIVILLNSLFTFVTNLPKNVGDDVPAGKLNSLSYAPFRDGQDPMLGSFPSAKQLDEDLALMGQVTHGIRTYASAEGSMPLIPDLAKKHGLTLLQGGWLGALKADNAIEMEELIRSANAHPDVIKRVIVGNEVLLRGDLEPEELIEYIRAVKRAIKQPVSYADVWSMYMKYPELIKEVDFITIHILPYWEDEPIAVSDAPAHIERIYKQVQKEADAIAPHKPILIGESGWPSGGKQRGWSVPSVVNEAQFIRALIKVANKNGFDYNIVEAFDQPWKAAFEGTIGAKWGLYNTSRQQVFSLTGKVVENPTWCKTLAATTVLFLIIVALFRKELVGLDVTRLISFLAITQLLSTLFVSQGTTLWTTSYTDFQRLQTLFILSFNVLFASFMLQRIVAVLTKQTPEPELAKRLYYCLLAVIIFALFKTAILAWDGRYVDFPTIVTRLMVVSLVALAMINFFIEKLSLTRSMTLTTLLGYVPSKPTCLKRVSYWLIGMTVALLIGESYSFMVSRDFIMAYPSIVNRLATAILFTLVNTQLLLWVASLGVLATPFFISGNANITEKSLT